MSESMSSEFSEDVDILPEPFAGAYDDPVFELDNEGELVAVRCVEDYQLDFFHLEAGEPEVLGMEIWD